MAGNDSRILTYVKGARVFCPECGAHVATFSQDIFSGEQLLPSHLLDHEGQAPWHLGEPCLCRECHAPWMTDENHLVLLPPTERIVIHRGDFAANSGNAEFQQGRAARQATAIAIVMDKLYNQNINVGLTDLENEIFLILQGHLTSEIQMFEKERAKLAGRTH